MSCNFCSKHYKKHSAFFNKKAERLSFRHSAFYKCALFAAKSLQLDYAFLFIQFKSLKASSKRFTKFSSPLRNHTRGS
jgi:menaquinone-dependent protoporphyrinogen IX oxidase